MQHRPPSILPTPFIPFYLNPDTSYMYYPDVNSRFGLMKYSIAMLTIWLSTSYCLECPFTDPKYLLCLVVHLSWSPLLQQLRRTGRGYEIYFSSSFPPVSVSRREHTVTSMKYASSFRMQKEKINFGFKKITKISVILRTLAIHWLLWKTMCEILYVY